MRARPRPAPSTAAVTCGATLGAALVLVLGGCSAASSAAGGAGSGTATPTVTVPAGGGGPVSTTSTPGAASTAGGTTTPAQTTPVGPQVRLVRIAIDGKKVTPPTGDLKVPPGTTIRFQVTSTQANEIHLHGVEVEKKIPAGGTVTVDTTYTDPGVYEVEAHEPSLLLVRVVVR